VTFEAIADAAELEKVLNNIPGVVENGLFVGVTDVILVGEFIDGQPQIREIV
jgi:ribose 5-phosphate isomerase A